ncbi:BRCT domain-containing protein [Paracidovorax citrulli]
MQPNPRDYFKFTSKARLDKAINALIGIVEGIAIDGHINNLELDYLNLWLAEHDEVRDQHPFNELVPVVTAAVADGILTEEEHADILWLCERLRSTDYYDSVTADLQRLHAIMGGIVADAHISVDELRALSDWMADHEQLKTCWPFDEVGSLITSVLADKQIDGKEHAMLHAFFAEFTALLDDRTITRAPVLHEQVVVGLCAVDPEISFLDKGFCFTGASSRFTRAEFERLVQELGGSAHSSPTKKVHYLVIGAEGNPCWAFACYGRKVEKAIELRKAGTRVVIVHELDFHDALADHGS